MNEQRHEFKPGDLVIVARDEYTAHKGIVGSHALVVECISPPKSSGQNALFKVVANGSTHMLYESELDAQ